MKRLVARLIRSDDGQDLIEYGLLVGIITIGAIAGIQRLGRRLRGTSPTWMLPCPRRRHGFRPGEGAQRCEGTADSGTRERGRPGPHRVLAVDWRHHGRQRARDDLRSAGRSRQYFTSLDAAMP